MTVFKELCKIGNIILSYLFPKEPLIENLEKLDGNDFHLFLLTRKAPTNATSQTEPWIHPLLPYRDDSIEKVIHEIKYYQNNNLAQKLALEISIAITSVFPDGFFGTIIPLPPRKKRLTEYGFDQNTLVLGHLPKETLNRVNTKILIRNDTAEFSLTKMKRAARLATAKNLYKTHPDYNPTQNLSQPIIVYDDVTTTGASLQDARRCLIEIGIRKDAIIAITLAH